MTALLTEFTSVNDVAFEQAYLAASQYVSELHPDVELIDLRTMGIAHQRAVALSVYAASHVDIQENSCLSKISEITARQAGNIGLSVGVAAVGDDGTVAKGITEWLGHQPTGSSRWVVAVDTPAALYQKIVEWLIYVIAIRRRSSSGSMTLAGESALSIEVNGDSGEAAPVIKRTFFGLT